MGKRTQHRRVAPSPFPQEQSHGHLDNSQSAESLAEIDRRIRLLNPNLVLPQDWDADIDSEHGSEIQYGSIFRCLRRFRKSRVGDILESASSDDDFSGLSLAEIDRRISRLNPDLVLPHNWAEENGGHQGSDISPSLHRSCFPCIRKSGVRNVCQSPLPSSDSCALGTSASGWSDDQSDELSNSSTSSYWDGDEGWPGVREYQCTESDGYSVVELRPIQGSETQVGNGNTSKEAVKRGATKSFKSFIGRCLAIFKRSHRQVVPISTSPVEESNSDSSFTYSPEYQSLNSVDIERMVADIQSVDVEEILRGEEEEISQVKEHEDQVVAEERAARDGKPSRRPRRNRKVVPAYMCSYHWERHLTIDWKDLDDATPNNDSLDVLFEDHHDEEHISIGCGGDGHVGERTAEEGDRTDIRPRALRVPRWNRRIASSPPQLAEDHTFMSGYGDELSNRPDIVDEDVRDVDSEFAQINLGGDAIVGRLPAWMMYEEEVERERNPSSSRSMIWRGNVEFEYAEEADLDEWFSDAE